MKLRVMLGVVSCFVGCIGNKPLARRSAVQDLRENGDRTADAWHQNGTAMKENKKNRAGGLRRFATFFRKMAAQVSFTSP